MRIGSHPPAHIAVGFREPTVPGGGHAGCGLNNFLSAMTKKSSERKSGGRRAGEARNLPRQIRRTATLGVVTVGIGASLAVLAWLQARKSAGPETSVSRPRGEVNFNKDIAPILFQHCAGCHRPGQSAPFALLSYADVKKRAADIARVTAQGYMPPWLPERGYAKFVGERRLATTQIGTMQQWVARRRDRRSASRPAAATKVE